MVRKAKNEDSKHFGLCFVALGLIITTLLIVVICLLKTRISYSDQQKLLAFDGLAGEYISEQFYKEGEQAAYTTGTGVTKDNDLYVDFVIEKYQDHIPVSRQNARLHFQCHDGEKIKENCAYAYWYGDEVETTEEERQSWREQLDTFPD